MDCQATQSLLLDLDDSAVDRATLLAAASHALACDACRQFSAEADRIASLLRTPNDAAIELPAGGFDALSIRLGAGTKTRHPPSHRWVTAWASAAALVTLVAGAGYLFGRHTASQRLQPIASTPRSSLDAQLAFSPGDVRRSTAAFGEVSAAFDQKAAWLWMGDDTTDLGVTQSPVDPAHGVLILKLVMRAGEKVVSSGDLVIVSGRNARLSLPLDDGKQVRYLIHTTLDQPDRIDLTAELLDGDGSAQPIAALSTRLRLDVRRAARAGEMSTTTGEYELIINFARAKMTAEVR